MLSVRAIYDGKQLKLLEKVDINKPTEVIVTFMQPVEEDVSSEDTMEAAEKGGAFDFLHEEEDLYSDEDLKVKYDDK